MTRRSTRLFTLLVVAMLALPSMASAQGPAEAVWGQLNRAFNQLNSDGFGSMRYIIGRMPDGARDTLSLTLPGGNEYRILGACDADCSDLDLYITLGDELIDSDVMDDDVPILNFSTEREGRYTVRVSMAKCTENPCFWGIVVVYRSAAGR